MCMKQGYKIKVNLEFPKVKILRKKISKKTNRTKNSCDLLGRTEFIFMMLSPYLSAEVILY